MKIIGITGGIGCGKSSVLHYLSDTHHAYILEADALAHNLMQPGQPTYQPIVDCFGKEILRADSTIDRAKLGALVFADDDLLEKLNALTHPAVRREIERQITQCRREGQVSLFALEAALLLEEGYHEVCDEIWYLYADVPTRIERLMASRGYTREKCLSIMQNQSTEQFYRAHCQHTIDNTKNLENTKLQIDNLLKK